MHNFLVKYTKNRLDHMLVIKVSVLKYMLLARALMCFGLIHAFKVFRIKEINEDFKL